MAGAGDLLTASMLARLGRDKQATAGTRTSTSYGALTTGTACGLSFTVPPSATILVVNSLRGNQSTASQAAYCTFRIRAGSTVGSGTDIYVPGDAENLTIDTVLLRGDSRTSVVTAAEGLVAGAVVNIQQEFRVSANTGTWQDKTLTVLSVGG